MAAGVDWVKELQRKLFEECVSQDRRCPDSTDSTEGSLRDVPVSVVLTNVQRSFAEIPKFRQRSNFLGELKKSLTKVARDKRINWFDFKESSERWFIDLANLLRQDGNNNIRLNHSNVPKEISEKSRHSIEEPSCSDTIDEESNSSSIDQLDTVASSYSLNSSGIDFNITDSTVESSGEPHNLNEDVDVDVDLKVRIRRFNEETDSLREELLRADETISTLEHNKKLTQKALDQVNNKYSWLLKEHEEQKKMVIEAKRREESCKLDLRKLEKAYRASQKKVEELESQKENISSLKAKIDRVVKENTDYTKQLAEIKFKYDEKIIEHEYLQEEFNELKNKHNELQKCFQKNLEHHQEKMVELQLLNAELQLKLSNNSDSSERFPVTPPLYGQGELHTHSTPYQKVRQDSLFSELKATGFSFEDSKIQDLKQELSSCNEEIAKVAEQVDEALQEIAAYRNEIYVPNVQLVETDCIQTLKLKITSLLDLVKRITTVKAPAKPTAREDARCEKPDVLPSQSKRIGILTNDQLFGTDEPGNDLISSISSPVSPYRNENEYLGRCDKSSPPLDPIVNQPEDLELSEAQPLEVIVPIVEALNRIIELKNEDENNASKCSRFNPKLKAFDAKKKVVDWSNFGKQISKANVNAKGDGKHVLKVENCSSPKLKIDTINDMKTLKSDVSKPSPDDKLSKIDTRFVTIRENTYLLDPVVSSTEEKSSLDQSKLSDTKHETSYFTTPLHTPKDILKVIPRRKLSVYTRSFDVENLQTPDSAQCSSSEKKRSISTPDVQESDLASIRAEPIQPLENSITSNPLLTTYRCANNSDSSLSPSPTKKDSIESRSEYSFLGESKPTINRPVILAPTKFHLPDSTVNKTITIEKHVDKPKPVVVPSVLQKKSFEFVPENDNAQQSRILSGSSNLMNKNGQKYVSNGGLNELDLCNVDSSKMSNLSMASTVEVSGSDKSVGSMDISDSVFPQVIEQNDKTYTKRSDDRAYSKGESAVADAAPAGAPAAPAVKAPVAVTAAAIVSRELGAGDAAPVARAMSSGEDSSVESECDVRQPPDKSLAPAPPSTDTPPAQTNLLEQSLVPRRRSNSYTDPPTRDPELQISQAVIDKSEKNSCQNNTSKSPAQETKKDEIPKAFPSWTDEKLQESGIASFPDLDSELSESLTEDELKKKFTAFSVGLGIDRSTLSKRMILSRRQRDQAEKNYINEVTKMHQDITDLELLCVDHESMERVHRVDEQLEMVTRCAYRISCCAETLGAVHQERRVSRAVLLADKYLQTLRVKCEKFAAELVETKKILAENNIMLEENLSELGDDVPRVRYRAVPNNNRTMMARRRASIATISRPLMGSNQDISKDAPRQRNSVSGRVPSLRRPSLCFETPKIDNEKLDRTDSSSSIREIFEQTESRRHSREENNNSIRTSVNNLSTITGDHTEEEEEEIWSNTREEIAPESTNDGEVNFLDLRHQYRHPIVCWISDKYVNWKPMIWGILIAFLLGIFMDRVVSSSKRTGPPISWWSIEEILNQYIQVTNAGHPVPRPI